MFWNLHDPLRLSCLTHTNLLTEQEQAVCSMKNTASAKHTHLYVLEVVGVTLTTKNAVLGLSQHKPAQGAHHQTLMCYTSRDARRMTLSMEGILQR